MNIRRIQESDAEQLIDFLKDFGWWNKYFTCSRNILKDNILMEIRFCLADNSHTTFIAEDDNSILGYISVHFIPYLFLKGPEAYISELFLSEDSRGLGIDTKLIEAIKEEAIKKGCSRLSLLNGRNRESYDRKFYEKKGFTERERMANFIFNL